MKKRKELYERTWLICLMFAFWFMGIPFIVGIILLYKKNLAEKRLLKFYGEIDQLQCAVNELAIKKDSLFKEYEDKNLELTKEHEGNIQKLTDDFENAKEETTKKLIQEEELLTSEFQSTTKKLVADYENGKKVLEDRKKIILKEASELKEEIADLKKEILELTYETFQKSYAFSDYDGLTSEECKNRLSLLKTKEQSYIKDDKALINRSLDSKRKLSNNIKQLLRCFNAECDNVLINLSVKNIDTQRSKIQKSFESLNKIFETDGISLSDNLLVIKLEMLNLTYTYELKKVLEREQQKAIKEQIVEEEKVRREIEHEKQKIEKEEAQFKGELTKLIGYMQKTDSEVEKNIYIDKIKELESKLLLVEKDKENVLEREQNTRAGFVYVVSNIGSFGENVYKIGMTRRLEPMDRIKELGGASVPFEFDVHAMIFSADAPALETTLHQHFKDYQLNKVNPRKEFFRVNLTEVEKVVKENHNATVEFTLLAQATQYRASIQKVN